MLKTDKPYIVMGLLDVESIAYAIGRAIQRLGGRVVYTIQGETLKKRYLDSNRELSDVDRAAIEHRFCDVSREDEVARLFAEFPAVAGVVHSVAYANPRTCLGEELHTSAVEDVKKSYEVSCVSLATVARHAAPAMRPGGGGAGGGGAGGALVALTFDTTHVYPYYNWMGVHKAALEALVRALARRHGRDGVRVNAVSCGPLATTAASRIPGFDALKRTWSEAALLPWDPVRDKASAADAVAFLLSPLSAKITGQILTVDAGASIVGGSLLDFEKTKQTRGEADVQGV